MVIQFVASNMATAVNFLLSIILARMLTPAEIGIFSMAAVVVGMAHVFRDFGVASFIKRQKELTPEILRSAMGVLICASWSIAALLFFLSWPVAEFFRQDGARPTLQVLAAGFIFIPFGSISQAVLGRDMQVEKSVIVTAISTITYFGASLGFAWVGFSYMTMAWANLVNVIISAVVFSFVRPKGMPWLPSFHGWGQVMHFGAGSMAASIVKSIDDGIGDIVLGRLSLPHLVGIFSRANSTVKILFQLLGPTIDYTALPYLAKIHHDGSKVAGNVAHSTSYLTVLIWPALLATTVYASDIIDVLYGQQWLEAAVAIPWLCLAVGVRTTFHIIFPAVTSIGRPYWAALPIGGGVLLKIALTLITFDGTLVSFCRAIAISEVMTSTLFILIADRLLEMPPLIWWQAIWKSSLVALVCIIPLAAFALLAEWLPTPPLRLLFAGVFFPPAWIAICFVVCHPITSEFSRVADTLRAKLK